MKKFLSLLTTFILLFGLGSCTQGDDSESLKTFILGEIDFYLEYNDVIEAVNSPGLPDVEDKILYTKEDFFNYDKKENKNVELEYDNYYMSFVNLLFVKEALEQVEDFKYKQYFSNTITTEQLYVDYSESKGLYIEYFENIADIGVIMRHSYQLKKLDNEAQMIKYIEVFDTETGEKLLLKKLEVSEDVLINQEYYLGSGSFVYEYTSYLDQEYFKYKGTMANDATFLRQTVEFYIPSHNAYVSFDIKEDALEDYRVKLFKDGHRVLKVDVNVKNVNPTVNELTWNLLSVEGWTSLEFLNDQYFIYRGSNSTLLDYDIDLQLDGYGKITAYKIFEGTLTDEDITLASYDLNSGYTLNDILNAKSYFESNYIDKLTSYGFNHNDPNNKMIVYNNVYNLTLRFEQYIEEYK